MRAVYIVVIALSVALWCRADVSLGLAENIVSDQRSDGAIALVENGKAIKILVDANDFPGVRRAAGDLCADIEGVTDVRPKQIANTDTATSIVIVGTIGRSPLIDQLIRDAKISIPPAAGRLESFNILTVDHPLAGIDHAIVIAGSDKRGTIYGIYELSEQIGVSPWYWWADVPPHRHASLYIKPGNYFQRSPVVRYRGIFLNDEAPCLTGWAAEKFGGLNSKFYTKVFELLLRLRANYLWPAMWDNAFNEDDPDNARLADEYGIVMGTSHHEPMMRAHKEWTTRQTQYGNGEWNYATNAEALKKFFRQGIARNKDYENLVTVGMRGDGDEGMVSTGSLESDIELLKKVFVDQRQILADELHRDPAKVPQLWALFTEVQKYYEHGLRPPDDVTLLWTDDNTGNLRRLPTAEERKRSGGAGIYYHFDMHGGPFAYQWINTNPLPKIAEQMNLAAEYGATRIWIVNVGDLKPLELPIEFFLRLAWNPVALGKDDIQGYLQRWAARDFGPEHATEIAEIVRLYTKYNGWRKPEVVKPDTFSQLNFLEAERVEAAWKDVVARADKIHAVLPENQRDAFYQLVYHPAKASAIVAEMNIAAGRNALYGRQGRSSTNLVAARVRELFQADRSMSEYYNNELAGGKWRHLMDQTHLGQTTWEPPIVDTMPAVTEVLPADREIMGVSIEGDPSTWPGHFGAAVLPTFDFLRPGKSYIDVFPLGRRPIEATVSTEQPWIILTKSEGLGTDVRYWVTIDWAKAPEGRSDGQVEVKGPGPSVHIKVPVIKASRDEEAAARGRFATLTGTLAFAASDAPTKTQVGGVRWEKIPDYGREEAAVGIYPVTAPSVLPPAMAPCLEYPIYLPKAGSYNVTLILGPAMDFDPDRGVRIGVSMDDGAPQVIDIFKDRGNETFLSRAWWNQFTKDNARYINTKLEVTEAGPHAFKITMVDPAVVVQKIIISDRPVPHSYFGAPNQPRWGSR